uniref:SAP domain-containing protein n=1 Tax=Mola mola TaxID=94237 RepID=A0A3Q4BDA9_MOLML
MFFGVFFTTVTASCASGKPSIPLQSLRVADLKAALEERNLPKSGQKNTLIKRLKGVSFPSFLRAPVESG